MAQLLKRWEEHTFHLLGQPIRLKVKAPHFSEEGEFNKRLMAWGRTAAKAREAFKIAKEGGTVPSTEDADALFSSLDPTWAAGVFESCVRVVEPIQLEDEPDAPPITTGKELFEIANGALVMEVLGKVGEQARLGLPAGKASSSPSTSEPAGVSDAGASPATSTESADGPTP
jgi:hypothetical protein